MGQDRVIKIRDLGKEPRRIQVQIFSLLLFIMAKRGRNLAQHVLKQ